MTLTYNNILVAVDGSQEAEWAFKSPSTSLNETMQHLC